MLLKIVINWELILQVIAALIVIAAFFEKVIGITLTGKKIYKGAPAIWKRMMAARTFRLEMRQKVSRIESELTYNGGSSTKDMVKMLIESDKKKTEILARLESGMNLTRLRQDINDINSDRMVFWMDDAGACTFMNEAFLKTFGYTWRDVEGFNWESIIHHDDIDEVRERWDRAIKTKGRYVGDQRIKLADGEIKTVRVIGYPMIEDEILKGFYGTIDLLTDN